MRRVNCFHFSSKEMITFKKFCFILCGWSVLLFVAGCNTLESGGGDSAVGPVRGVLIDAGHGGEPEEAAQRSGESWRRISNAAKRGYREECYGAINSSGYKEKTATLAVARKVQDLLQRSGIRTAMTRSSDRYVPLNERVAIAMSPEYRDWIFVSIHFNRSSAKQQATNLKAKYREPRGFEIYIMPGSGERSTMGSRAPRGYVTVNNTRSGNRLLAESVSSRLDDIPGMVNRGVKTAWFVVLRGSPMPSILIEGGFMSNPEEGRRIASEEHQWTLAKAIANGIQDYQSRTTRYAENSDSSISKFSMSRGPTLRDD